ncbi:hypothetical protein MKW94_030524 [Papaver nudicaule]|uniref:Uncharacterized protein n=1 Tax=Papaver nudicaule TaxID=74823 RepID=A0AA41SKH5_PAPNU|nr:hypothetical protein [Papaver nudicaule]
MVNTAAAFVEGSVSIGVIIRDLWGRPIVSYSRKISSSNSDDDDLDLFDEELEGVNQGLELCIKYRLKLVDLHLTSEETVEVYYRNEETGNKSRKDPKKAITKSWGSQSPSSSTSSSTTATKRSDQVLVVAGCKSCLMYFMLPKYVVDCPKCSGIILHFDRFQNGSSIPWVFS